MITIVSGIPGSGKSTYAAALAVRACRKRPVFSNFAVNPKFAFPKRNGVVHKLDGKSFFKFSYPPNSLLILDEAALDFDARKWDSFPPDAVEFVKIHRHMRIDIIFISQSLTDIDKKIRTCAEQYISVSKGLFGFSRLIKYEFVRPKSEETSFLKGGELCEEELTLTVREPSLLAQFFTTPIWRPAYYKAFDSFGNCGKPRPFIASERWS